MADSPEITAIEEAYHDRIQLLFTGLATNLGDKVKTEQQCIDTRSRPASILRRRPGNWL
jgi:hypothetical protein